MTYSSALFADLPARWDDLAAAQDRKIDRLLDLAGVGPGTRLLEIGTGWGELALRAAARGAQVLTVTLSEQQREFAAARVAAAGLTDRVTVELRDYRDVRGRYDAVVSAEMIEAVGAEYWPAYFRVLERSLAPGGRIALQSITMPDDRMRATLGAPHLDRRVRLPRRRHPLHRGDHPPRGRGRTPDHRRHPVRPALRRDAAPVARALHRGRRGRRPPRLRPRLPPHVGLLPRLLRGRLPGRLPGRQTDRPVPRGGGGGAPAPAGSARNRRERAMSGVAERLGGLAAEMLGGPLPVGVRGWDGSRSGPAGGPVVVVRSPRALRRMVWRPGELGLAEAYIAGDLDVEGDVADALGRIGRALRERAPSPRRWPAAAATALRLGAVGPRPPAPGARPARLRGLPHSTARDRAAISHHYDLSNDWYAALLDPSMAYSCGYWRRPDDPAYGLADAQRDKLELVCRKLGLAPGARLLDMGCGWGSLSLYAAREFKAKVTAVTLSREQRDFVVARSRAEGLDGLVEVELAHYREFAADLPDGGYDAASAIEMGEHVGERDYPGFAAVLHRALRPRGRLLVQQMSRGSTAPGGGAFIEAYIAPDMHMRPLGRTVGMLEDAGLEVRSVQSLREDYARTIDAWRATLEDRWPDFTALAGESTARVWRLYLAGASLAFSEGRMGVDQILATRPTRAGATDLPPTPAAWYAEGARP